MGLPRWPLALLASLLLSPVLSELERSGAKTALPTSGTDKVFTGPEARVVVTVEAAGARSAVPADFDGDGRMDIVVVSSSDNTVAWYRQLPDGTYSTKQMISKASNGARIVSVGDIDQDNKTDVIVASYYDHTVGWFKNLGGSFGDKNMITRTALSAQGVSVGDLDGDGDLDVLSASSGDNKIAWYENFGGGNFCEVKSIIDGNSPGVRTVIAADLDEDGYVDVAAASKDDGVIAWYRNDGHQNFEKIIIDDTVTGAYSLVAKDVDLDGHLDLVLAANMDGVNEINGEGGLVSLYRNHIFSSTGQLCNFSKIQVTAGNRTGENDFDWFVLSVWAGDLDRDGDVDIASASFGLLHQGGVSWYENIDGFGNEWARHQVYVTDSPRTGHYVYGADMDNDGDVDLVVTTNGDNKVQVLMAATGCDDSTVNPREECCMEDEYWDGSACTQCPLGTYLETNSSLGPSCLPCNRLCPRPGLSHQPATCQSMPSCGDAEEAVRRCDCGQDHFLDTRQGICVHCADGQITFDNHVRTMRDFNMVAGVFLDQTKYFISDLRWSGFNASRCMIPACDTGKAFDMETKICTQCQAGRYSLGGPVTTCLECPAGSVCSNGSASTCQAGSYSEAGAAQCEQAAPGSFTGSAGLSAALPCPPGTFSAFRGAHECQKCGLGTYAYWPGAVECTSCSEGKKSKEFWTTMKMALKNGESEFIPMEGAVNYSACGCAPYTRLIEVDEGGRKVQECSHCTEGLDCRGMKDVRLVAGYWASVEEPYRVFLCDDDVRCPGGMPGSCAGGLQGRSCVLCEDGFVWNGVECKECRYAEKSRLLFPTLPILMGPIVVYALYRFTGDKYPKWRSWQNGAASLAFVMLNHYQILQVLGGTVMPFPVSVSTTIEFWSFTEDIVSIFRPNCAGFASFQSQLWYKSLGPAIVALVYALTYFGSHIVARAAKLPEVSMEAPRTLNAFLGVMFAFFGAVSSMAFSLFKCSPNPCGLFTLSGDLSIVCYQGEWSAMLAVGSMAVLVWCIGFSCLFLWMTMRAPVMFANENFRTICKFLVIKYRPDVHWWAVIVIVKGIALNLVYVLVKHAALQVTLVATTLLIYSGLAVTFRPWRHRSVNMADAGAHACLTLTCVTLAWFAGLRDEEIMRPTISTFCVAMTLLVIPACAASLMQLVYTQLSDEARRKLVKQSEDIRDAFQRFAYEDDQQQLEFLLGLEEWDFWFVRQAGDIIFSELVKIKSRNVLSMHPLAEERPPVSIRSMTLLKKVGLGTTGFISRLSSHSSHESARVRTEIVRAQPIQAQLSEKDDNNNCNNDAPGTASACATTCPSSSFAPTNPEVLDEEFHNPVRNWPISFHKAATPLQ